MVYTNHVLQFKAMCSIWRVKTGDLSWPSVQIGRTEGALKIWVVRRPSLPSHNCSFSTLCVKLQSDSHVSLSLQGPTGSRAKWVARAWEVGTQHPRSSDGVMPSPTSRKYLLPPLLRYDFLAFRKLGWIVLSVFSADCPVRFSGTVTMSHSSLTLTRHPGHLSRGQTLRGHFPQLILTRIWWGRVCDRRRWCRRRSLKRNRDWKECPRSPPNSEKLQGQYSKGGTETWGAWHHHTSLWCPHCPPPHYSKVRGGGWWVEGERWLWTQCVSEGLQNSLSWPGSWAPGEFHREEWPRIFSLQTHHCFENGLFFLIILFEFLLKGNNNSSQEPLFYGAAQACSTRGQ